MPQVLLGYGPHLPANQFARMCGKVVGSVGGMGGSAALGGLCAVKGCVDFFVYIVTGKLFRLGISYIIFILPKSIVWSVRRCIDLVCFLFRG